MPLVRPVMVTEVALGSTETCSVCWAELGKHVSMARLGMIPTPTHPLHSSVTHGTAPSPGAQYTRPYSRSAFCGSGVMRVSVHAIDICRTGGTLVGMRW